jgi:hypothetical protein
VGGIGGPSRLALGLLEWCQLLTQETGSRPTPPEGVRRGRQPFQIARHRGHCPQAVCDSEELMELDRTAKDCTRGKLPPCQGKAPTVFCRHRVACTELRP